MNALGVKINKLLKILILLLLAAGMLLQYSVIYGKQEKDKTDEPGMEARDREKSEIIVIYKDDSKRDRVRNSVKSNLKLTKLETKQRLARAKADLLEIDSRDDIQKVIEELRKDPDVKYVQPNYKLTTDTLPADSLFAGQWGLKNTGQEVQGVTGRSDVDINILDAWDLTQGSDTVIVGLLDSGIDASHEDLAGAIYANPNEIPDNGIDDDGNGKVDDVYGWDFYNGDNTIFDSNEADLHGTYMAGIIAARANDKGIRGVAPNVRLLPLKFISGNSGYTCDAIAAIEYAIDLNSRIGNKIKVINCSFGSVNENPALRDAMENSGFLFVCAGGNRALDVASAPVYPACFDIPNILSVASIDSNGMLAPFSSYGSRIHIAAPGINILSTMPENQYGYFSGTSVSAAHVTGIAALLLDQSPSLLYTDIAARIRNNARHCTSLEGKIATEGRVDANGVLTNTPPAPDTTPPQSGDPGSNPVPEPGDGDDALYTMEQISLIREQIHYGENGVNTATGNFSFTVTDMSMTAPGFEVKISRTYNSKSTKNVPFGRGWTFGFEGSATGTNFVTISLPNGSVETFTKNADGSYMANDSRNTLTRQTDNTLVLTTKDQYTYGFNTNGRLVWMKDRNGNTVTMDVDETGRVTGITDIAGRHFAVIYGTTGNTAGLIERIEDPAGRVIATYEYNDQRLLIKVTDAMGITMNYVYDSVGFLSEIRDHANTIAASIEYKRAEAPDKDRVIRSTDAMGLTKDYNYDIPGKKTTVTDSNDRMEVFWYDTYNYTTETQDAEGKFSHIEYFIDIDIVNKYGDIRARTDRNGNTTVYNRDSRGNVTEIIYPDGSRKVCDYDEKNNKIWEKIIEKDGFEHNYVFYIYDEGKKNLIKKAQPLNGADQYTQGCDESRFAITRFEYYTPAECTALGYAAKSPLKSVTDPENNTTAYAYDTYGNICKVTDPELDAVTYEYNTIGLKTAEISQEGYRISYEYNGIGQLERKTLDNYAITRVLYDSLGRKMQEVTPKLYDPAKDDIGNHAYSDSTTGFRYTYYPNGKLYTVTDAENYTTTYEYDEYGNKITETFPNGGIYVYDYDNLNRLKKVSFKEDVQSAATVLEEYSYAVTVEGRTQKTYTKHLNTSEKAVTVSLYDFAGRLIEQAKPDLTRVRNEYDASGNIIKAVDAKGSEAHFKYDGMGRLSEKYEPFEVKNGQVYYSYTKYEYYKNGWKKSERMGKDIVLLDNIPSTLISREYTYKRDGKLESITDDEGRMTVYDYDHDGNVSREEVYTGASVKNVTEYENNQFGRPEVKRVYMRKGDLSLYDFSNEETETLTTAYTYDKNGNIETVTTPDAITTAYAYDNLNRKISTSRPGKDEYDNDVTIETATTYNWDGKPLTVTDAQGYVTEYFYNKRGMCEKVILHNNGRDEVTAYGYDIAGRKTVEVDPGNYAGDSTPLSNMNRHEYTYDLMGWLRTKVYKGEEKNWDDVSKQWGISQVSVVKKAFDYDKNGNVVLEQDALGYEGDYGTEYTYNLANKTLTVIDPVSRQRGLAYTVLNEYDGLGRKISETNASGVKTSYEYDNAGNIKSVNVNGKRIKSATYDLAGRVITQTDGNGNTTVIEYNALNKVRKNTLPGDETIPQRIITFQYDKMGNLAASRDSVGTTDTYIYDSMGRQTSHTQKKSDGSEAISAFTWYDENGNARFIKDGRLIETENTYDGAGRLLTSTKSGKATAYSYDKNGNLKTQTDWLQDTVTNNYDAQGRLIETIDPEGKSIQKLEYDKNGAQVKSYDALGNLMQYAYDRNGRLLATTDPEGHETSQYYDNAGNISTKTDGRNISTTYTYDIYNRLESVVNAKGEITSYIYDDNNNLLTQTDGKGNVTTYRYNAANKVRMRMDPGGEGDPSKTESYTYHADGNLATKTDRNGNTTVYTYDSHGRLINETTGGLSISYAYDNNGNQLTMTDSTGVTARTYDDFNRVLTKTVPDIGITTFEYDIVEGVEAGCVAERSTDPKGNVTLKVIDRVGRLKTVTADGQTTSYEYYDNGSRKNVIYPDLSREDYTYYKDDLLWTLTNTDRNGNVMDSYSYTYDEAHNQLSKYEKINGVEKGTTNYTYDSLNRLETVTEPGGKATQYGYDAAGNRQSESVTAGGAATTTSYFYNRQNRLTSTVAYGEGVTETIRYTYDNNGNMLSKTEEAERLPDAGEKASVNVYSEGQNTESKISFFEYDILNRLIKTTEGDKTVISTYNGDGLRVAKAVNGEVTRYLYEYDKVVLETDGQGNQTARNVYGLNLLKRQTGNESYYYMYNGHADVTALIGTDGTIEGTYYYDAFGNITEQTGSVNNPIRYAGYQYDTETGLYYLNARMYDPKVARFLQEDTFRGTAEDPLSLNLYSYCHNDPIMYVDPTGHYTWESGHSGTANDPIVIILDPGESYSHSSVLDTYFEIRASGDDSKIVDTGYGHTSYITDDYSKTLIESSGSIDGIATGDYSNTSVNNSGYIGYIQSGDRSTLRISNSGYISDITTGDNSTFVIENKGRIDSIISGSGNQTGDNSNGNSIINNGLIWNVITGRKSTNDIRNINEGVVFSLTTGFGNHTYLTGSGFGEISGQGSVFRRLTEQGEYSYYSQDEGMGNAGDSISNNQKVIVPGLGSVFEGKINTNNLVNMSKSEIINNLPSGWTYTENNGFVHVRDTNGNIRIRIDPPDKVTKYDHVHFYNEKGEALDKDLNPTDPKSKDAHQKYKGPDDNDKNPPNTPSGGSPVVNSQGITGVQPNHDVDDGGNIYDEYGNKVGFYNYDTGRVSYYNNTNVTVFPINPGAHSPDFQFKFEFNWRFSFPRFVLP